MKRLLLSTVALVGFAGVASAADLPQRVVAPVAPYVPAFTWTGFYIGVNAGAAFDVADDDNDSFTSNNVYRLPRGSVINSPTTSGTLSVIDNGLLGDDDSDVGFTGGGQIGYNYQFTPGSGFVVGLEADIQYIDIGGDNKNDGIAQGLDYTFRGSRGIAFSPPNPRVIREQLTSRSLDYFGTVRGRLGYAFDRTLIYATGGFAYGGGDVNTNGNELYFNDNIDDDIRYGWTVGGGVEFALSNFQLFGSSTMTFKIEGLYVNLENDDNNQQRAGQATYNSARNTVILHRDGKDINETEFAVIRAGINFKF